jgi:hypothetical protein
MSETETVPKVIQSNPYPNRTTKGVHQRKEPKNFEWNNLSIKAYQDIDIEVPETLCRWEKLFLSKVDVSKGPIERSVVSMVRLKAPDYSSKEKVPPRKEWIYFMEKWEGKGWNGVPLNPVAEHIEGYWVKQFTKPHFNEQNGEIDYYVLDAGKGQTIYTIPYSKKAVDDIIAKSANTDKDSIVFTIKFGNEDTPWGPHPATRAQFSYEQFSSWSWTEICKHQYKPTVEAYNEWIAKEKAKDGLSFQPT